jgi:hypothetical protein
LQTCTLCALRSGGLARKCVINVHCIAFGGVRHVWSWCFDWVCGDACGWDGLCRARSALGHSHSPYLIPTSSQISGFTTRTHVVASTTSTIAVLAQGVSSLLRRAGSVIIYFTEYHRMHLPIVRWSLCVRGLHLSFQTGCML